MALLILGGLATDLVEPEDPRRIATVPMGAEITRLAGRGRYLGVGTRDMDLRMFSLEDPTRPRLTHRLDTIGLAASLLFPDSLLYFVEHRLGLKVVEVSRSGTMGILSHLPVRNAAYLTLWRTRGFLVAEGVHILDLRNPRNPLLVDTLPLQVTTPVAVAADAAFLCIRAEGVRRLELDAEGGISDPERMMAMEEGQYALALGRGTLLTRKEPFLLAWDVADPRQPKLLGRTDVAMRTLSLVRHADYLYLAKSRMGGLQVLHAPILRGR